MKFKALKLLHGWTCVAAISEMLQVYYIKFYFFKNIESEIFYKD